MKKRVLSVVLTLVMILSLVPTTVFAAEQCLNVDKTSLKAGESVTLTYTVPNAGADAASVS